MSTTQVESVQAFSEAHPSPDAASLEAAIQQIINLGTHDPLEVARLIEKRYDEEWLRDELWALREDVIQDMARQRINGQRHSAMSALAKKKQPPKDKLLLLGEWVPNSGWKRLYDWTQADLRSRENYYRKMAGTALRLADWCLECIGLMEAEGVKKLGKVKADLPVLTEAEVEAVTNGSVVKS